jgi:hypothetical protein
MDDKTPTTGLFPGLEAETGNISSGASSAANVSVMELFVSLFLILLCFFVVMNSISNQQLVKAHAAVKSVEGAFKDKHHLKFDIMALVAKSRLDEPNQAYYADVHNLLAAMVDFSGRFPDPNSNPIRIEIPANTLFVRGQSRLRFDQAQFFDSLATALKDAGPGEERSLEILVDSGASSPGQETMWRNLYVKRAANFAKEIEKRGVPGGLINAGVITGGSQSVWIILPTRRRDTSLTGSLAPLPDGGDKK